MSNTLNNEDYQTPNMPEMASVEVVSSLTAYEAGVEKTATVDRMTSQAIDLAAAIHKLDSNDTDDHRTEKNKSGSPVEVAQPSIDLTDTAVLRQHGAWIVGARVYELAQNALDLAA